MFEEGGTTAVAMVVAGGGDAKSIRSRHYNGVGLARVAVRIKKVVVGRSEVVTMADTRAVSRQG